MSLVRALWLGLALCLSATAFAQDDDDLPPLPTKGKSPAARPKPKPKPAPTAARPRPKPAPVVDEDLPPLIAPSANVLVKLTAPLKGARLLIDDREVGPLPQPAQNLTNGEHTVTIKRLGYATWNKSIRVAGKQLEVAATLDPVSGVLSVASDVAGAEVFINGRSVGESPLSELEVPAGTIEVSVRKDGYHDGSQTVSVKAGHDYPVEVKLGAAWVSSSGNDRPLVTDLTPALTGAPTDLGTTRRVEKNDAVYTKVWFWGIVAVGVAAIATGVSLGAYAASPAPKLSQEQICKGMACSACINCPAASH